MRLSIKGELFILVTLVGVIAIVLYSAFSLGTYDTNTLKSSFRTSFASAIGSSGSAGGLAVGACCESSGTCDNKEAGLIAVPSFPYYGERVLLEWGTDPFDDSATTIECFTGSGPWGIGNGVSLGLPDYDNDDFYGGIQYSLPLPTTPQSVATAVDFTIDCTTTAGPSSDTVRVIVQPPQNPSCEIDIVPSSINSGDPVDVVWTTDLNDPTFLDFNAEPVGQSLEFFTDGIRFIRGIFPGSIQEKRFPRSGDGVDQRVALLPIQEINVSTSGTPEFIEFKSNWILSDVPLNSTFIQIKVRHNSRSRGIPYFGEQDAISFNNADPELLMFTDNATSQGYRVLWKNKVPRTGQKTIFIYRRDPVWDPTRPATFVDTLLASCDNPTLGTYNWRVFVDGTRIRVYTAGGQSSCGANDSTYRRGGLALGKAAGALDAFFDDIEVDYTSNKLENRSGSLASPRQTCTASTVSGTIAQWNGSISPYSGNVTVPSLFASDTFKLNCTRTYFDGTQKSCVDAIVPIVGGGLLPPAVTLVATPALGFFGGSSTLTWDTTSGVGGPPDTCIATGSWNILGSKDITGGAESQTNIMINKSYTITCTNLAGSTAATATVTIPPKVTITATPSIIPSGGDSVLNVVVSQGASTSCTASGSWVGAKSTLGFTDFATAAGLTSDESYTITCVNAAGSNSDTANVTVIQPPVLSFNAVPKKVPYDGLSTLVWSQSGGTPDTCTATGDWGGSRAFTGSDPRPNLKTNKTYTLTCTNIAGSSVRTETVKVAPFVTLTADSTTINDGDNVVLTWTVVGGGAFSCTEGGDWTPFSPSTSGGSDTEFGLTGPDTLTYTMQCAGGGGTSNLAEIDIVVGSPMSVCGDMVCEVLLGENPGNCPADCTGGGEEL